jgi:hypothetical protein
MLRAVLILVSSPHEHRKKATVDSLYLDTRDLLFPLVAGNALWLLLLHPQLLKQKCVIQGDLF